jgi:hypothetical protein
MGRLLGEQPHANPRPRKGRFTTDEALIEFTRGTFGEIVMSSPLSNMPGHQRISGACT